MGRSITAKAAASPATEIPGGAVCELAGLFGNHLTELGSSDDLSLRVVSTHSPPLGRFACNNALTRAAFSMPGSNSKSSSGV